MICNVEGCEREATVTLLGAGGDQRAYRCWPCLEHDLARRDDPAGGPRGAAGEAG